MRFVYTLFFSALAFSGPLAVSAQELVVLIRHADKAEGTDPPLTEGGEARARYWAEVFRDSRLDLVVTSSARRTRQTGVAIAEALGLPSVQVPANDVAALVDLLTFDHDEDRVLVVGHAETIPSILDALGVPSEVVIEETAFDHLFLIPRNAETAAHIRVPFPAP